MKKILYVVLALVLAIGTLLPFSSIVSADYTIHVKPATLEMQEGCDSIVLWHFVITQIDSASHAPGSITLTFSDSSTVTVNLEKFTGGVAHYTYTADAVEGLKVTDATASIYDGWAGQFNLSHIACGTTPPPPTARPLIVTKTAVPAFTREYLWNITKEVDKTEVKQVGGSATFNYTVGVTQTGFTDNNWTVAGTINVYNPNEDPVTVNVTDVCPGGVVAVTGGVGVTIAAGDSADFAYSGTFAAQPAYNTVITNTATATWIEMETDFSGTADFQFTDPTAAVNQTVHVTDSYAGSLGSVTAANTEPFASGTFTYSRSISVINGVCAFYDNTANITETNQTASQEVTVCGPIQSGGLTMGFWQNKNGQAIIKNYSGGTGGTSLYSFLTGYNPFKDLTTNTGNGIATYTYNVIKAATASGTSMNAMLKAQMLATALDVYFSDPSLGGNRIGASGPIGDIQVDLTWIYKGNGNYENVSGAFNNAASMTVEELLDYAAGESNSGGSIWYGNDKATQGLAKDAFDAINNQWVFAP